MKSIALTCILLSFIATPALALQGSDCSTRAERLKGAERENFMKSCLNKAEEPANVQEEERKHKNALCEQNAKNKKLQGNDKAAYQANCVNKNEAAAAATSQPKNVIAANRKPATSNTPKNAARKDGTKKQAQKKQKGRSKGSKPAGDAATGN